MIGAEKRDGHNDDIRHSRNSECIDSHALQSGDIADALRGIEVVGTAERMVVPDELTFRITLSERGTGRSKITINSRKRAFVLSLKRSVSMWRKDRRSTTSARYFRYRRTRDVLATQNYRLVIRDLEKVAKLQEIADKLNVSSLDLVLAENAHIEDIRQELRIEAIKNARAKAEYIMSAIAGHVGSAIFVKEVVPGESRYVLDGYAYANAVNASVIQPLSFAPEKETVTIIARFEIK
ncbi:MAG: SIMPL domain-containing protein [Pyrinomonadaceae bacterium]